MLLSGRDIGRLRDALVNAFDADGFKEMVRIGLDIDLAAEVPPQKSFKATVFAALEIMQQRELLPRLVVAARDHNPSNQTLATVVADVFPWVVDADNLAGGPATPTHWRCANGHSWLDDLGMG